MKIKTYNSKDRGDSLCILLCEGDSGDLVLLPPKDNSESPCLCICEYDWEENTYIDGHWTNTDNKSMTKMIDVLVEIKKQNFKLRIEDSEEYNLYLKLKKKYEMVNNKKA